MLCQMNSVCHFAHNIIYGFKKPLKKFMVQMLHRIQASQNVKLSNIARSSYEEIPLTAIFVERLRYNTFSGPAGRMALK